jgi:hypothetical protein
LGQASQGVAESDVETSKCDWRVAIPFDNNGFDGQFINWCFHHYLAGRRILGEKVRICDRSVVERDRRRCYRMLGITGAEFDNGSNPHRRLDWDGVAPA